MHEDLRCLATNVRTLRVQAQLTQAELAQRAQMSPATVAKIEQRQTAPTLQHVNALAHALGVTLCYLLVPHDAGEPAGCPRENNHTKG